MKGYVAKKGNRWYAVIYDGLDPVTGRERRSWHAAGPDRADAERLAARLAAERNGRNDETRSLTFGAFLTHRWLPPRGSCWQRAPMPATDATSSGTSFPFSGRCDFGGFVPTISKRSTRSCSTPPTTASVSHPRPCTRSTS